MNEALLVFGTGVGGSGRIIVMSMKMLMDSRQRIIPHRDQLEFQDSCYIWKI